MSVSSLKAQLGEGVDFLGHMDVIAVGDVALVRDARHDAKATLQALRELVGDALDGRAVDGVVDVLGKLPLGALAMSMPPDHPS